MLKDSGFRNVSIDTHGFNPFEVINHYKTKVNNPEQKDNFKRVETSYKLNEELTKSPVRKHIKNSLNYGLSLLSMGDSLKIKAEK